MNIAKFSIKNSVFVNILMVAVLSIGGFYYLVMPRELMSEISFNWVFVTTVYPGAGPEEVEKSVTIPIEKAIANVERISEISSQSKESFSFIMVKFDDNLSRDDFVRLQQDLQTRVTDTELPDGCDDTDVEEFSTSDFIPILSVVLSGELREEQLQVIGEELEELIEDVKGVSKVDVIGNKKKEVTIEVNRQQAEPLGITLSDVVIAIGSRNIDIPGGKIRTRGGDYTLRTIGEVKKIEEIGDIIIKTYNNGRNIKLSEIASISPGFKASRDWMFYLNQKPSITISISKKSEGNTIKINDQIKKLVKDYKENRAPEAFSYSIFMDTSVQIKDSLLKLQKNAVVGFFLVILILWLFLGFRNAFLTALGIPIAFASTFIFMNLKGESLNGNSLFGLVLVLGMIVDHAIVIVENCYRHMQHGKNIVRATIDGCSEVMVPVFSATLTTIACFLPLMLLPGIMGKFMYIIPLVVTLALVSSMIEALVILPSHFSEWGKLAKARGNNLFLFLQRLYRSLMTFLYRHRFKTVCGAVLLFLLSA
ncbi:MAG: efflux RND transporter permease subunit, partial [bacterium]